MKLAKFLLEFPDIKLACAADNQAILDFFEKKKMSGEKIAIHYKRDPDFFAFLRFHSSQYFVFMGVHQGEIEAIGTLVLREGFYQGKKSQLGYLGDMRITHIKRWGRAWRKFYSALLENKKNIDELKDCAHFYTVIMQENHLALRSLRAKKNDFHYKLLAQYKMINIFHSPKKLNPTFKIHSCKEEDVSQIKEFLTKQNQNKKFGLNFSEELDYRLKVWPNFRHENIFLVRKDDKLIATGALWTPSPFKRIMIEKAPICMRFLSWFGLLPKVGDELRCLYLTQWEIAYELTQEQRREVLRNMIAFAFKQGLKKKYHCLSLAHFEHENLLQGIGKCVLYIATDLSYFEVMTSTEEKVENEKSIPGFEISLV